MLLSAEFFLHLARVGMDRTYDIFEKLPSGEVLWRAVMVGREPSLRKLQELAAQSSNEIFAVHLPIKEIIATLKGPHENGCHCVVHTSAQNRRPSRTAVVAHQLAPAKQYSDHDRSM